MCVSLLIASTALATASSIQQGKSQEAFGEYQQKVADNKANAEEAEGRIMAGKIRKAKAQNASDIRASLASTGLDVNSVSANDAILESDAAYESDALAAIYSGQNQGAATRAGGAYAGAQGRAAKSNALMTGAASGLQGWSRYQNRSVGSDQSAQRRELAINRSRG